MWCCLGRGQRYLSLFHEFLQFAVSALCTGAGIAVVKHDQERIFLQTANVGKIDQTGFVTEEKAGTKLILRVLQTAGALINAVGGVNGDFVCERGLNVEDVINRQKEILIRKPEMQAPCGGYGRNTIFLYDVLQTVEYGRNVLRIIL